MSLLHIVQAHFERQTVAHALIGAAALAAAGVARSTFDVDVLVMDRRSLETSFWDPVGTGGVTIDVRRGDRTDPLAGMVRLEMPGDRPVDVVVGRWEWQRRALERALRPAGTMPVVQARDLVLLKLYAGGTQDLWDIRQVLALPGAGVLRAAVEEDLPALPPSAAALWRMVCQPFDNHRQPPSREDG